ncbi:MAG: DNA polymerase IV [Lachnospiraceae bacterium]|nr:DNA polymerase IV [Lachnospiraceae bacterium]
MHTEKERLIFHIDVNSAFLNWTNKERKKSDPDSIDLLSIPAAIGGDSTKRHGIILAKSPIAKAMGVTTGEPIVNALRKCPNLVLLPTDFKTYNQNSALLMDLLLEYSPIMQQFSIDEAFLDMTDTIHLFGEPIAVANALRERVANELSFTVNIGISTNKLLAKMASDFKKPNLCHTLFPHEIPQKMWPLPVGELFGVGRSARQKLSLMGIRTIGELARMDLSLLQSHLGMKYAAQIHASANGIDLSPVEAEEPENKGIGNSTTLSSDVTDFNAACQVLLALSEAVGARLRKAGHKGSCITVEKKDCDFKSSSHQTTLATPTASTNVIYDTAVLLLKESWDASPLRLLGIRVTKLNEPAYEQLTLFQDAHSERLEKLDVAIDSIRDRFGAGAIRRASFLKDNALDEQVDRKHR